jgi:hypothetical protein
MHRIWGFAGKARAKETEVASRRDRVNVEMDVSGRSVLMFCGAASRGPLTYKKIHDTTTTPQPGSTTAKKKFPSRGIEPRPHRRLLMRAMYPSH